jgi:uncharacterized protein DUF6899
MPYIKVDDRLEIDDLGHNPETPGELNYVITLQLIRYLNKKADAGKKPVGYTELNEVIGVLEACKLEFYRRIVTPYENLKIKQNGDVY